MAKKKNITKDDIISFYMNDILEHSQRPKTVYIFAKHHNFEEATFYEHFNSFDAVEKGVFKAFFDNTHRVLEANEDYINFEPRDKLLSFYFTFFENLTTNRSYVMHTLYQCKDILKSSQILSELKSSFTHYIKGLDIDLGDLQQDQLNKIKDGGLMHSSWLQLLLILKFWMDDSSPSFEKTDVFIEKSVNTSFDLINTAPLKSLVDLGKFIFKEKIAMN